MSVPGLHDQAADSLKFIRTTMARSVSFTVVPGRGGIVMGVVGVAAAISASAVSDRRTWRTIWLLAAVGASSVGLAAMHVKARLHQVTIWSASGRRFLQGCLPSLVAGAVLTAALVSGGAFEVLPAVWLLLYGAGVVAGATASIGVLTWLGVTLMALGAAASLVGHFGVLHIIFGFIVSRKHGG